MLKVKAYLFNSSATKKAINSTRLQPGVMTRHSTRKNQYRVCRRKIGSGLRKKTATKTSHPAGHLHLSAIA